MELHYQWREVCLLLDDLVMEDDAEGEVCLLLDDLLIEDDVSKGGCFVV